MRRTKRNENKKRKPLSMTTDRGIPKKRLHTIQYIHLVVVVVVVVVFTLHITQCVLIPL